MPLPKDIESLLQSVESKAIGTVKEKTKKKEKMPIDELDTLIAECNANNAKQTITKLKELFLNNPDDTANLIEEFISQSEDQIHIAETERTKCDSIDDPKTKAIEKAKWTEKIQAIVELNKAIRSNSLENQDE